MKIKSIKLKKFRQYLDFYIEFSVDDKKNVTILKAENSVGKTTLMQSIIWCLYGKEETNLKNLNKMINSYIVKNSLMEKERYWVEVEIIEQEVTYTIRRTEEIFISNGRSTGEEKLSLSYVNDSGETMNYSSSNGKTESNWINNIINKILTKQMSHYFLFDGERINSLGDNTSESKKDIKNAITAISGIPILQSSLARLRRLKNEYSRDIIKHLNDEELSKLDSEKNNTYDFKVVATKKLEKLLIEKEKVNQDFKILNEELKRYDDVSKLTRERNKFEIEFKRKNNELDKMREKILSEIGKYQYQTNLYKINKKYENLKYNEDFEKESIPDLSAGSIEEIISRGTCICGENLDIKHIEHLNTQKKYQPPFSHGVLINQFRSDIKRKLENMEVKYDNIKRLITQYYDLTDDVLNIEEEVKNISSKIDETGIEEIQVKNKKRQELAIKIKNLEQQISDSKVEIGIHERNLDTTITKLNELISKKNSNAFKKIKVELIEESIKFLEQKDIEIKIKEKNSILEKANIHFKDIIYKDKSILLNDNFEYTVVEADQTSAAPSEGEQVAVSMSLILAIIDTHRENLNKKEKKKEIDVTYERDFSVIMDAAFANLDNTLSEKISEKLPEVIEQVILFTTEKQLEGTVKDSLTPYIGRMYNLSIAEGEKENAIENNNLKVII